MCWGTLVHSGAVLGSQGEKWGPALLPNPAVQPGARPCPHLLLHARLQQQHHTGFDGQRDLSATPLQVFLQRSPEGWLLRPLI